MKRYIAAFCSILLSAAVISAVLMAEVTRYEPLTAERAPTADCILVLGCQVREDGPSPLLTQRLETALALWQQKKAPFLILSGGKGSDEPVSESESMYQWLLSKGVPDGAMILEDHSTSTWENLRNSRPLMTSRNVRNALVVTNDFHMTRSIMLCERADIRALPVPAPTLASVKPAYCLREMAALLKSWVLDRP